MSDYKELVKALRYCAESGDFNCNKDCPMYPNYPKCLTKMDMDAAAAIEELKQIADHYEQTAKDYWKEACEYHAIVSAKDITAKESEELIRKFKKLPCGPIEPNEPKRGEWELIDGAEPMRWGCSRCKYLSWETSNYCPRCGAKMEVQE